jgi:hypothetical protein
MPVHLHIVARYSDCVVFADQHGNRYFVSTPLR